MTPHYSMQSLKNIQLDLRSEMVNTFHAMSDKPRHPHLRGFTTDGTPVASGRAIFILKDTHGLPFSISFDECEKHGVMIDWVELVDTARSHGWKDYQIWDQINEGFQDSDAWRDKRENIKNLLMAYIMGTVDAKTKAV